MNIKEELKNALCNNDYIFLEENKNYYSINERFEDENNDTLLLYSIGYPLSNAYNYLLKNNADTALINDEGENIIHSIVFSGDNERLKKIMNNYNVDINHQAKDGATPLLLALSLEKNDIALSLIKNGANTNLADSDGITPLHIASQSSNLDIIKALIENGANLLLKTNNGNLPLALAVNSGNYSTR